MDEFGIGDIFDSSRHHPDQQPVPPWAHPTGFPELDEATGGLHPGDLVVAFGQPGVGVTPLLYDVVRYAAVSSRSRALLVPPAETPRSVAQRLVAAEAGVPTELADGRKLADDQEVALRRALKRLDGSRLRVAWPDPAQLVAAIRSGRFDVSVVDDLDAFIHAPAAVRVSGTDRRAAERGFAWELKTAARDSGTAVLAGVTAQLTPTGDPPPSGDAADVLLHVARAEEAADIVTVRTTRHRRRPAGTTVRLAWVSHLGRVANIARPQAA